MAHITEEMLQAYAEGCLPAQKEMEVMEHIAVCDQCAEAFATLMTEEKQVSPPPDLKREILRKTVFHKNPVQTVQTIQERKREKQREFFNYSMKVIFATAASVFMVITMSSGFEGRQKQEMPDEIVQVEQNVSEGEKKSVSKSLQEASGKVGDAVTGFLDVIKRR